MKNGSTYQIDQEQYQGKQNPLPIGGSSGLYHPKC